MGVINLRITIHYHKVEWSQISFSFRVVRNYFVLNCHSNAFSGLLNEIFVCARESNLLSHTPNVGLGETERYPEDYQGLTRARKTSKIC